MDADGLVESGEVEDLPVVLGQSERQQLLVAAAGAHEQRHEQADAAAVERRSQESAPRDDQPHVGHTSNVTSNVQFCPLGLPPVGCSSGPMSTSKRQFHSSMYALSFALWTSSAQ